MTRKIITRELQTCGTVPAMAAIEQVHSLDAPVSDPPNPQRLPWVVATVAAIIAALALIPRPAIEPPASDVSDTFPGKDVTCQTIADGSVTIEERGGQPSGRVVTGTGLAVCVWILPAGS